MNRLGRTPRPAEERFWEQVDTSGPCWPRMVGLDSGGYSQLRVNGRKVMAHRFAYELLVGPIPAGMEIDHVKGRGCTHRNCVNPAHLEIVTHRENALRSDNVGGVHARTTHCPHGHEYTDANTVRRRDGGRDCRACQRARDERRSEQKRARKGGQHVIA